MDSIFLIGTSFALFFSFLLFNKKGRTVSDIILFLWLLIIAIHIFVFYLESIEFHLRFPHIVGISDAVPFLYGPLLYIYADTRMSKTPRFKHSYWLHFIPFVLANLIYTPFYLLTGDEKLLFLSLENGIQSTLLYQLGPSISFLKSISGPIYIVLTWFMLRNHGNVIPHYFSYTESIDLRWLKNLTISLGIFWVIMLITLFIGNYFEDVRSIQIDSMIFSVLVIWVIALGYFGLKQKAIFPDFVLEASDSVLEKNILSNTRTVVSEKYQKSGLTQKKAQLYCDTLTNYMKIEKPYLQSELTIEDVSRKLEIPKHYLSQIINQHFGKNFYQFINQYRVEEAKKKILNPVNNRFTLLAIGLDSGFNSKSTFNTIFKGTTDMTPSEFREKGAMV